MAAEPSLSLETDTHRDQIAQILALHEALGHRHGEAFRALARRIEALTIGVEDVELHDLGDCRFLSTVPKLATLLRDGRALGVI